MFVWSLTLYKSFSALSLFLSPLRCTSYDNSRYPPPEGGEKRKSEGGKGEGIFP